MTVMADIRDQAVTGVSPPQVEAIIRDVWPSVITSPGAALLAGKLQRTIILAPLGWLLLLPTFTFRLLGFLPGMSRMTTRYRLTNKRLSVCKGMKPVPDTEVPLDQIQDVRLVVDTYDNFYRAGTLEVFDPTGKVILTLPGVREPESFRHSVLQAAQTWGPLMKQP